MEGHWRTNSTSLRPRAGAATTPLPRTVLRHLVAAGGLGIGSRVLIAGDDATATAAYFEHLGMDAAAADAGPWSDLHDVVLWIGRNQAPPGTRSLTSRSACEQTLRWIGALRPQGTLLLVNHLGQMTGGHSPECLRRHLAMLPGRSELAVIPERPFLSFLRESARPAYAVAAWRSPEIPIDTADCRRRIAAMTAFATSCCTWSEETVLSRRVA